MSCPVDLMPDSAVASNSVATENSVAAALLAFALCLDDYVITSFVAGNTQTFPLWVYGATRLGVPPQVNAIGTFIFLAGALLAVTFGVVRSWRNRQLAREAAS